MSKIFAGLNYSQIEAVKTTNGPVLMLAGAGSGKTKTLTHRIAYLISEVGVEPSAILAVTFTNKAASEMKNRVVDILSLKNGKNPLPFLGTFHSIANKILRREAGNIGYDSNFLIFDTNDSQTLIKKILKKLSINDKTITPSAISWAISSAKNELINATEYKKIASGNLQSIAARVYPIYERELRSASGLDFDDLIMKLVELFNNNHKVLERYQNQFKYIMVDEYQDTNHAQYQMIKLLANLHQNICVVGDDWQSIYSWRGANYQNILNFETDYPNAKTIKLEQNYRSTQRILDAAHHVIAKSTNRSHKQLWTELGLGEKIHVIQLRDELQEGRNIIQIINELRDQNPSLSYKDFVILYRTNAQSRSIEESFLRYNIPYQVVGSMRFYDRREIKDILAYMRVIFQPNDMVSLNRIFSAPPRGIGPKSINLITDAVLRHNTDLIEVLLNPKLVGLRGKAAQSAEELGMILSELKQGNFSVYDLMDLIIKRVGYLEYLNDGTISSEERIENVKELLGVAKAYRDFDLETFLSEIALVSDIDNHDPNSEAVTLMTLHAVKGLEFEVVFMVGMEEGLFPHSRTFFEPEQLEEERRLCYVGMTRAKSQLYLLHTASRRLFGSTQHNVASRFITDIPEDLIDQASVTETTVNKALHLNDFFSEISQEFSDEIKLNIGDLVVHEKFGKGRVENILSDEVIISFDRVGKKTLNLQYAPLKKF